MTAAVLICAGLLLAWLAAYIYLTAPSRTAPYQGKHVPFADPADDADPDGDRYVAQLRAAGRFPYLADEPDVPDERDDLACWDEDEPDAGWHAPGDDPATDDTGQLPHAVGTWGKTAAELHAELAARYLP